jgi:hypothetical protein
LSKRMARAFLRELKTQDAPATCVRLTAALLSRRPGSHLPEATNRPKGARLLSCRRKRLHRSYGCSEREVSSWTRIFG